MNLRKTLHIIASIIPVFVVVAVIVAVHYGLKEIGYHQIRQAFQTVSWRATVTAAALTAFSYFLMTLYDTLAFRYVRQNLPYSKIAFTSFVGYTLSNNVGYSFLSGGSIRYRFYSAWGLSPAEVLGIITFCTVTGWLGFMTLAGSSLLIEPRHALAAASLPPGLVKAFALVLILFPVTYLTVALIGLKNIKLFRWSIPMPSRRLALTQWALGLLDFNVACLALYVLMPGHAGMSYAGFVGLFMISIVAGLASHVPGGLGVFEGIMTLLLAPVMPAANVLAALILFRFIYYLLPLAVGLLALATFEIVERRAYVSRLYGVLGQGLYPLISNLVVVSVFACGLILLISGATPAATGRMRLLRDFLPLPVVEMSHFLASMAGLAMLLLARALQHRVALAYWLTCALLAAGAVFSLLKGFDYEEAIILTIVLAGLIPSRQQFNRRAGLFSRVLDLRWIAAVALAAAGSVWLGIFVHRHAEYSNDLWWKFSFNADIPRFLRASVGLTIAMVTILVMRLLRPIAVKPNPPVPDDLESVREILKNAQDVQANLALLPDKYYVFNENKTGLIMYGIQDRLWVSMGDPVASDDDKPDLVWKFHEACEANGALPIFYEVKASYLPLYVDAGLMLYKLGEEARVPLESFSLEGSSHKSLRNTLHKLDREGYIFQILSQPETRQAMPELRNISEQWLEHKKVREKGFSLGRFDEDYLSNFPHAVVKKDGQIVAFSNIWQAQHIELSPDLMRYLPTEHASLIDFLFLNLMLWGRDQGFTWFNLGMAPLAGLETYAGATLWNRLGVMMYRHGEVFYNFHGLRTFKEKFDPVWEPRYLACPKRVLLPTVLVNTAALTSGGIGGIISK